MEDIQNMAGQAAQTPEQQTTEPMAQQPPQQERMYSKGEVVELMKKRVARSHNSFFNRYGVKDLAEMDEVFNRGKSMQDEFGIIQTKNAELVRENAFLRNNISPDKYNDIIAYFKGNDLQFSEDELLKALATHPEWVKQINPVTTIKTLGSEMHNKPTVDEKVLAGKYLGVNL